MSIAILQTKLYIPPLRPGLVARARLIAKLNAGHHSKLTLISAPAGFGKTTLVSAWFADLHAARTPAGYDFQLDTPNAEQIVNRKSKSVNRVAWLSLDEGDSDPIRFLTYLVAVLQTVQPELGQDILGPLQSPQPPPVEAILTALLNEIATIPDRVILVLDDYHVLDAKPIDEALLFLLEHMPPQLHLVMTTREDPSLPLARYRVRGELTEIRAADLRFTAGEAAEFLNQMMGLNLAEEEIAALEIRTEGWIAGLQMAALSMQGRSDSADFIQAFAGSHRFVLDYLVDEVLLSQPEDTRRFLLQTSILDRLTASLCDAVNRQANSKQILEALERANLFIVPLDDRRQWYRYHHLFAEVLQVRLREEQSISQDDDLHHQLSDLHRRASEWYEQHDFRADAIHHAFAAEDDTLAADLIELAWPAIPKGIHPATWLGWLTMLPEELVSARPILSAGAAWMLLDAGELEAADARLRDAERWLVNPDRNKWTVPTTENGTLFLSRYLRPTVPGTALEKHVTTSSAAVAEALTEPSEASSSMVVVNKEEFCSLHESIATARAYLAQSYGDYVTAAKYAQQALNLLAEEEHYWRGGAAMFLSMAHWGRGDLEAAYRAGTDSVVSLRRAGNSLFQVITTIVLADIRMVQGRLNDASRLYEQALALARSSAKGTDVHQVGQNAIAGRNESLLQITADLYVGLSALHRERGDLDVAAQQIQKGQELGKQQVSSGSESRLCIAMARIEASAGELDKALEQLQEAEHLYKRDAIPDVCPIAALQTRIWVKQDQVAAAMAWAQTAGLAVDDNLSYRREFEHITLARVLIADYQRNKATRSIHEAIELLTRLLSAAEAGGRMGSVIEILMLQALAHHAQGDIPAALTALTRALTLAEPKGYTQLFVDEGDPMQTLLAECLARGIIPTYVAHLLAAMNPQAADESGPPDLNQLLIEPLSKRELDVLRLLAIGHTNQAVADELVIAVSTVKKHVNNIFGKLGVANRTQAISRARELDMV